MISFIIPALNESKFISTTLETINTSVSKVENIKEFEIIIANKERHIQTFRRRRTPRKLGWARRLVDVELK